VGGLAGHWFSVRPVDSAKGGRAAWRRGESRISHEDDGRQRRGQSKFKDWMGLAYHGTESVPAPIEFPKSNDACLSRKPTRSSQPAMSSASPSNAPDAPDDPPPTPAPVQPPDEQPSSAGDAAGLIDPTLTAIRAHYLKKTLIQLQFNRELDDITSTTTNNVSTLSFLGSPFAPPPQSAPRLDLPFLRFIFRHFVLTFPFMAAAPKDFYSDKLQPFIAALVARNLSPVSVFDEDPESSENATRIKLLAKVERNLSVFLSSATKLTEPEEVVRLNQADLDRLELTAQKRQQKMAKEEDVFNVNIISVRTVVDKGRVRSRVHEVRQSLPSSPYSLCTFNIVFEYRSLSFVPVALIIQIGLSQGGMVTLERWHPRSYSSLVSLSALD
jgi:hypothetical protein